MSPAKQSFLTGPRLAARSILPVMVGPATILILAMTGAVQSGPGVLAAIAAGAGGLYLNARRRAAEAQVHPVADLASPPPAPARPSRAARRSPRSWSVCPIR